MPTAALVQLCFANSAAVLPTIHRLQVGRHVQGADAAAEDTKQGDGCEDRQIHGVSLERLGESRTAQLGVKAPVQVAHATRHIGLSFTLANQ
eukprot:3055668-Prymnesium_polylepis.1